MYVTHAVVAAAEQALGAPRTMSLECEILPSELSMIRSSQRDGRAHDVTTVLYHGEEVLAISKPSYPRGVYRIPGGGLKLGEALAAGAAREAAEETGLAFEAQSYVLRVAARFICAAEAIDWKTHVLAAPVERLNPVPTDTHEIAEACWLSWDELIGPVAERMVASGRPLLGYRVALHQAIHDTMCRRGLLEHVPHG